MPTLAPITIHHSQWPASLAAQLRECLRCGRINPKFHYESPRQVRQWLRLHETCSPARREEDCRVTYRSAFDMTLRQLGAAAVQLIGLGCGGGQKEAALLQRLVGGARAVHFLATDVSPGMVITTLQAGWAHLPPERCSGLVCDLAEADDLGAFFNAQTIGETRRLITFFGMIPNFEPEVTRLVLQRLLRPGDWLLCSANLAPGADYRQGVEQVLPQYDNALTRDWLGTILDDLGIGREAGDIEFGIEEAPTGSGLLRISAIFSFRQPATAVAEGEVFAFEAGSQLRLFFSCRHTPDTLESLLAKAGLGMSATWISDSGEEGVFLLKPCEL